MDYTQYSFDYTGQNDFYFALFSDLHVDSTGFAREAFRKDAERAATLGARFLFNGDIFDAILPQDRKRYTRAGDPVPEDAQVNARLKIAFDELRPWVDLIDFIGAGNHEATMVKYNGVDLIEMLVRQLQEVRDPELAPIQRGSYQGFLRFWFRSESGCTKQFVLYRDHGKGGSSPVTRGTINLNRLHTTFVADLFWLGHSHTDIVDRSAWTIYPDTAGKIQKKRKLSVITAGYNEGFVQRDLTGSRLYQNQFPEEKFLAPTGIGCATLHIHVPAGHESTKLGAEIIL
jgi:hypothetical protein